MSEVLIWTDGSYFPDGTGGWAAILQWGGHEIELTGGEEKSTNNRAELMAVITGLEALKRPVAVQLYSDSQYVLKGATAWVRGWIGNSWRTSDGAEVKNRELWVRLCNAARPHNVAWQWVKGHAGNVMNERADELAKGAAIAIQRRVGAKT